MKEIEPKKQQGGISSAHKGLFAGNCFSKHVKASEEMFHHERGTATQGAQLLKQDRTPTVETWTGWLTSKCLWYAARQNGRKSKGNKKQNNKSGFYPSETGITIIVSLWRGDKLQELDKGRSLRS